MNTTAIKSTQDAWLKRYADMEKFARKKSKHALIHICALIGIAAVIGAGLLIANVAFAAGTQSNVSWTAPATYNDGSALPATDIGNYTITWTGQVSGTKTVPGSVTVAVIDVPCGSVSFVLSVTTTSTAKFPSASSDPTTPVPYASGVTCRPLSPTNLKAI